MDLACRLLEQESIGSILFAAPRDVSARNRRGRVTSLELVLAIYEAEQLDRLIASS